MAYPRYYMAPPLPMIGDKEAWRHWKLHNRRMKYHDLETGLTDDELEELDDYMKQFENERHSNT